jgi:hypothetical protein
MFIVHLSEIFISVTKLNFEMGVIGGSPSDETAKNKAFGRCEAIKSIATQRP